MKINDLREMVKLGEKWVAELRTKYPDLQAYPVFSRTGPRHGQCPLKADAKLILKEFPDMVVESPAKTTALKLLKEAEENNDKNKDKHKTEEAIIDASLLEIHEDVLIELRFEVKAVKYALIRKLQEDAMVDRTRSTLGAIRVVLGSLQELSSQQ